jgi:deoxyribonuclease V
VLKTSKKSLQQKRNVERNMLKPNLATKIGARFSVNKAHEMQLRLSKLVIPDDMLPKNILYVAGVDVAYSDESSIGAMVVLDYKSLTVVEAVKANVKTLFPYIPTLLSFREIRPTVAAIRKTKTRPDVFLVDGQGFSHPQRLGFASHLGLILDKPTIGVAKSLLCGEVGVFNQEKWAPIIDKGELVGAAIAQEKKRPIYVSVGHKISLKRAIEIVKHCTRSHRIPEPIRAAHNLANEEKKRLVRTNFIV